MSLDNSFDFTEFEKLNKKNKVPEETVSSLAAIYGIAFAIFGRSALIVLPYVFIICFLAGFVHYNSTANFDSESFWVAVAYNNIAYIQSIAKSVLIIFAINLVFVIFTTLTNNLFYSSIAATSKGTSTEKILSILKIFVSKFLPVLFVIIIKSVLIMTGMLMFLIPGIMVWLSMLLIEYVMIFENKGFVDSWKRSNDLMEGCKGNFITFLSIVSLLIVPIYLAKVFYNFDTEFSALLGGGEVGISFVISLLIEMTNNLLYGLYYCGTCLLYMKRTQIFSNLEVENSDAK